MHSNNATAAMDTKALKYVALFFNCLSTIKREGGRSRSRDTKALKYVLLFIGFILPYYLVSNM